MTLSTQAAVSKPVSKAIILFDGVCNLCSGAVQFIIKRDGRNVFQFASLQSSVAKNLLTNYNLKDKPLSSIVLIRDGKVYVKSAAALLIAKELSGGWHVLYYLLIIPRFIRDVVYDFIARNRYKWFGRKNECWIPSVELKSKFLDQYEEAE